MSRLQIPLRGRGGDPRPLLGRGAPRGPLQDTRGTGQTPCDGLQHPGCPTWIAKFNWKEGRRRAYGVWRTGWEWTRPRLEGEGQGQRPAPVEVSHSSQAEMLLRAAPGRLSDAPLHVGNSLWGECGLEAES